MKKRKLSIIGLVLLALAAVMLAVFIRQHRPAAQAPAEISEQPQTTQETAPPTEPPAPTLPLMDFSELAAQAPDVIGRLVIEGIGLDYPVVQGKDNSYYLAHTAERKADKRGALFLDYRMDPAFTGFKSIIYGHYVKGGAMFGRLKELRRQETFDEVTEGMLYTPERTWRLEIFASALTPSVSEFYHYVFLSRSSREKHLETLRGLSLCYRDIGVTAADRIVVLSTCSYEYEGARTVILARLAG